jgi:phosphoglycerate dehydrogenase-like enzyme
MPVVWTNRPMPPDLQRLVAARAEIVGPCDFPEQLPAGALARIDAVIANAITPYGAALFARMPALRVVARVGIGFDNCAVPEATAHGVAICNSPDGPTAATAELAIMLMIAAARHVTRFDALMRNRPPGRGAEIYNGIEGMQLRDRQLGVIGFGRIGRRVSAIARAIGMHVAVYDPLATRADVDALGVRLMPDMNAVLEIADVVTVHVPGSPENRRLIDAAAFARMRKGAVFVNAARGMIVDEDALYEALRSRHLLGAGIDVFEIEPVDPGHRLLTLDNLVALPHVGGATVVSRAAMWKTAVDNVLAVLDGRHPPFLVNPEVWPRPLAKA